MLTAIVLTLKLVGVLDVTRYLTVLLSVLFAYQTVFMVISLFVVLVRCELDKAPEVAAPMIGVESGDLGLISYLEKNTGITMRSLWSLQLMKKLRDPAFTAIQSITVRSEFSPGGTIAPPR